MSSTSADAAHSAHGEADVAVFLQGFFLLVRRRLWLILAVASLGAVLAGYVAYNGQTTYTAKTMVLLEPTEDRIVDLKTVVAGLNNDLSLVDTQIALMTSPPYLTQILDQVPTAELDAPAHSAGEAVRALLEWIPPSWLIKIGLASELPPRTQAASLSPAAMREQQQRKLAQALEVKQEGRSLILSISFTSHDPTIAATVANKIAEVYITGQYNAKLQATERASAWLETRLAELKQQVETSEQAIEKYHTEHRVLETRGLEITNQQVIDLTNLLVATRADRSEKETRLNTIRDFQARGERLTSMTEVLQSPHLSDLWQQDSEIRRNEAELRQSLGDRHPQLQSLLAEKGNVEANIALETARLVDNIANEVAVLTAKEASVQAEIDRLVRRAEEAAQAEVGLRQLERQADADRKLYEEFLQRSKETKEQQAIIQPNARIVAAAEPPQTPSSLSPKLLVLAGLVASSAVGLGLSWLLERLDRGVRSSREVEYAFELPCLGLVPHLRSIRRSRARRPHRQILRKPLSIYAESVRLAYTALLRDTDGAAHQVVQVTSSVPGEGKTVFAVSLATLLAHTGYRTLLLDLDLRHPSVRREINAGDALQLIRYVDGAATIEDLICRDDETGLDIVAPLQMPVNPAKLLASPRLGELIEDAKRRYDFVIVDSAPVLGVSDSLVVGKLVDHLVMVVQWAKTPADSVHDALNALRGARLPIGGIVLAQVDINRHAKYGYGGIDGHYKTYAKYYQR